MTSLFTWNETFLTRLPTVDEQHQRLVGMINDLGELVMSSVEVDARQFLAARDELLDYARVHFGDEEALMARSGLDARHIEHHRRDHRAFIAEAIALGDAADDISLDRVRKLVEYLVHWLAYHTLDVDPSMARQVRAIQDGLSAAEAFERDARSIYTGTEPLLAAMSGLFFAVSERNRELRALNRELEQRVRERTIELEQANRQLQLLSTHDDLTGLPNRRYALLSLGQQWMERRRFGGSLAVLLLDADHFKQVNDGFGHAQGDALLRSLAQRLRSSVRASDIVCRLGGDEFLVICPHGSRSGATEMARKFLAERQPFVTDDGVQCWDGGVSIGVAEAAESMDGPADLLRAADEALYAAKRLGGACLADRAAASH
jgi:hemerythrin